jgi:dienelactone hydrolase
MVALSRYVGVVQTNGVNVNRESPFVSRRAAIRIAAAVLGVACIDRATLAQEVDKPYGWTAESFAGQKIFSRGNASNAVVLLHELPGMSPGCIDFGSELAFAGFRVHMPLLFGHAGQNDVVLGTVESCFLGRFRCFSPGGTVDTAPVLWLQQYIRSLSEDHEIKSVGVIGMCETGAYPLATMETKGKVKAAVLSQPALPLKHNLQRDVGISPATMQKAKESDIPILALRFKEDTISTHCRMEFLQKFFGSQIEIHELDGPTGFQQTCTHRLHAVLTGPFGAIRDSARNTVREFLLAKLG